MDSRVVAKLGRHTTTCLAVCISGGQITVGITVGYVLIQGIERHGAEKLATSTAGTEQTRD